MARPKKTTKKKKAKKASKSSKKATSAGSLKGWKVVTDMGDDPAKVPIRRKKKADVQVAEGKLYVYARPEAIRAYKRLKIDLQCSGPDLAAEMLNLLFEKYDLEPLA